MIIKSRFITKQEGSGFLISLGLKMPWSKITLLGNIFFNIFLNILFIRYEMNEIVNKLLLAGNKFVSEMHLRQPGITSSTYGPFTKK